MLIPNANAFARKNPLKKKRHSLKKTKPNKIVQDGTNKKQSRTKWNTTPIQTQKAPTGPIKKKSRWQKPPAGHMRKLLRTTYNNIRGSCPLDIMLFPRNKFMLKMEYTDWIHQDKNILHPILGKLTQTGNFRVQWSFQRFKRQYLLAVEQGFFPFAFN